MLAVVHSSQSLQSLKV